MQDVIVIVTKNGAKYQFGLEKSTSQVINEITACKSDFYMIVDNCAIRIDEIISVGQYQISTEEEQVECKN